MTHEQSAIKFLEDLYLSSNRYIDTPARKKIKEFYRHMKLDVQKNMGASCNCACPNRRER